MKFEKVRYECFVKDSEANGFKPSEAVYEAIKLPERKTEYSCGYDFCTPYDVVLFPDDRVIIPTGIKAVDMPSDVGLMLYIRSSIGIKHGVVFSNGTGVIDADYANNESNDGDIHLALYNESLVPIGFNAGDRIAQGVFMRYLTVDDDTASGKRKGGIGSTND